MASTSKLAERFKDGVDEVVGKTVAQVRDSAERLSDNVHEHLDDAKESLMKGYAQARKRTSRLSRDARRYVRDNPGKSLLAATALGFLAGLVAGLSRRKR